LTLTQRPRVRGLEERFESRVLPLFKRRTSEVTATLPELYLHGLAAGDFELALRGLLGEGAPLSASSIARLRAVWEAEYATWKQRPISPDIVYLWTDGIYVKAGLEKEKAALLVVIGAHVDGTKEVLAVECGHRESEEGWARLLRDLKSRGMNAPRLVLGDGHLGIWAALARVFPESAEQRCWIHKMRNVLDCVGKKKLAQAKEMLTTIMYAKTRKEAEDGKSVFQKWARAEGYAKAESILDQDWYRMLTYYAFPAEHWIHLRTTNYERHRVSVRKRPSPDHRFEALQAGRGSDGDDLEAPDGGAEDVPEAEQTGGAGPRR
jgi:putative transposase